MAFAATAALALGCAGDGDAVGVSVEAVAPPGSGSAFLSNTIPTTMAPGERRVVTVTVQNTGATPGFNDWTITPQTYYLYRSGASTFGWTNTRVPTVTPVGDSVVFSFVIQAPATEGTYDFRAQMFVGSGGGFFGPILSVPVTVSGAASPQYACAYEAGSSTVPTTLAPDASAVVTVAVRNTGTASWSSSGFTLYSRNSPTGLWGTNNAPLSGSVAPGALATFTFSVRAPSTAGATPFVWDMFQSGVGFFGQNCVSLSIDVGGSPSLDAAVVSSTVPSTMVPGEARTVSITMQNTGTQAWTAGTAFALTAQHSPTNLFGTVNDYLDADVAPGANATFSFTMTAPATEGDYTVRYRVRKLTGTDAGFFGETFSTPVTVSGTSTRALACSYVPGASDVPTSLAPGASYTTTVVVQNTGSQAWTAGNFLLYSRNSPATAWGPRFTALSGEVAPGASGTFVFTITAPATPATTPFRWDMFEGGGGIGFFGQDCVNLTIDVAYPPAVEIDLASANPGRTFSGGSNLAPVTIGDVNGDDVPDVLIARRGAPAGVSRTNSGSVFGFLGGPGFFTGTNDPVPSDAVFSIVGAEANDQLGLYQSGNMIVGDVTGDGVEDIIVSAPTADGPANARDSAGEVYVIAGGLGLSSAGTIDLGATTPPTQLVATIYGEQAGDSVMPLAVGDLTGDGHNDLVLGAPQVNGSTIGEVYIVVGSASGISGTIDLAAPGAVTVHSITGGAAGDQLGRIAAVGDFMGDGTLDLLLGAPSHSEHALRDGAAYGFAGPITGSTGVGSADVTFIGSANADGLGSSVAIGDVRGTSASDVVIGVYQYRAVAGGAQSGAVMVFDAPVAPGVYDLSVSLASVTARVLGADHGDNFAGTMRLGDVDGDSRLDLIVGARTADGPADSRDRAGEVAVIRGGTGLTGTIDLAVANPALYVYGATASGLMASYHNALSAGDIDGDGRADFCVGTHGTGRIDCVQSPL